MRIRTQYNFNGNAFEIYIAGCKGNCKGCHNPTFKSFDAGQELDWEHLWKRLKFSEDLFDRIWILGGEPLDQDINELKTFLEKIRSNYPDKQLWLWTRYEIHEVPETVLGSLNFIKCGAFILESKPYTHMGITLASSNQKIYKIEEE